VPCGLWALVTEALCSPELQWPKRLVCGVEGVREARGQLWGGSEGGKVPGRRSPEDVEAEGACRMRGRSLGPGTVRGQVEQPESEEG